MIKQTLGILLLVLFMIKGYGQVFQYAENSGKNGLQLVESKSDCIKLNFAIDEFQILHSVVEEILMSKIVWGSAFLPGEEGFPDIPSVTKYILIPNDADIDIGINSKSKEYIENIIIAPSAKTPGDLQRSFVAIRGAQYEKDTFYPNSPIQVSMTEIRGFKVARISIIPFQFNGKTNELIINKNLEIDLNISSKNHQYGEDRYRSVFWDQILADVIFNYQDIPPIDYSQRRPIKANGCDMVILCPDKAEFLQWADTIRRFRNEQGIHTKIVTTEEIGGNDSEIIKSFFNEVYQSWDPVPSSILLLGDFGIQNDGVLSKSFFDHPENVPYVSDNYFADATNNDLPDFVIGRISAQSEDHLNSIISRYISYEQKPPMKASYYQNPLTVCGYQGDRWFQMCIESISGYMKNALGKNPKRIDELVPWYGIDDPLSDPWSTAPNSDLPINYFGSNGLSYLPLSPAEVGPWGGGNADSIVNGINAGSFITLLRDHGSSNYYAVPEFSVQDVNGLQNIEFPTHIFSMACYNGAFNYNSQSLMEAFLLHKNGGIISGTAATTWSWSFYNDCITWGMMDNLWPEFLPDNGYNIIPHREFRPAFGLAAGIYFMFNSNWIETNIQKVVTGRIWEHFGDPFGNVFTEKPVNNRVIHEYSISSDIDHLDIETEPYSLIGLSKDGELLYSAMSNEIGRATLHFPEQDIDTKLKLVVTKQNFYRYEEDIYVVPDVGPYLILRGIKVNDNNNNGKLEYNETASLNIRLRNYGVDTAKNTSINFTENDEYFDIISDQSFLIDEILPNKEMFFKNILEISTGIQIPDQHICNINYEFENTPLIPNNTLKITANAPQLYYLPMIFEEIVGNNNSIPEPGEKVKTTVFITNMGHSKLEGSVVNVSTPNPFIDIQVIHNTLNELNEGDTSSISYEMTFSENLINEASYKNIYQVDAGELKLYKEHYFNLGLIIEDFESADFNKFHWSLEGDQEWFITEDFVLDGQYAACARYLEDGQEASLILEYYLFDDNNISFYIQVSSENNKDYLSFYIDNTLVSQWSNLILFEEPSSFLVPKGYHKLKWVYYKNETNSTGLDAAWLDHILLPPGEKPTGINEEFINNENSVIIFPNPSRDYIYIYNNSKRTYTNLQIIDGHGVQLINEKININDKSNIYLPIDHINRGFYIIKLTGEHGNFSEKLIIY